MRLGRLFKRRGCAAAAVAAMFLCLAANAGAQDNATLWKIWNAVLANDGTAVVSLMRQNGIDINAPYFIRLVGAVGSAPDRDKFTGYATALDSAAYWGSPNVVKALLDAGADVSIRDKDGLTALMIAEREGREEMARLLRGARGYR